MVDGGWWMVDGGWWTSPTIPLGLHQIARPPRRALLPLPTFSDSARCPLLTPSPACISSHKPYFADMKITLEVPESAFSSLRQSPARFATELTLAAAVKWYELGRVSQAKAAEIAGLSRAAFIDALREYRVPAIQIDPSGLEQELAL
jgi:predicted HTH domain antitoxin